MTPPPPNCLQIYVENKALLNFPSLLWEDCACETCVYACDVGEHGKEDFKSNCFDQRYAGRGRPPRRSGEEEGETLKGMRIKQET